MCRGNLLDLLMRLTVAETRYETCGEIHRKKAALLYCCDANIAVAS